MLKKIPNPQLTIKAGKERRCVNLNPGKTTIGRKSDNMVVIPDPSVSGRHAVITITDDEVTIQDLGSTNGTYINKQKINGIYKLTDNTPIVIGLSTLVFTTNRQSKEESVSVENAAPVDVQEGATSYNETRVASVACLEFLAEDGGVIKTMPLDRTVNPLGRLGVGVAAISFGRNGWVLSPVDGLAPLLNGAAVTTSTAVLKNGDHIILGDLQVKFTV